MRLANPWLRAGLAFLAVVGVGGFLWLDWDARLDGFPGLVERRAAHAEGILSGAEWRAMKAAGDGAAAASGGDNCGGEACRTAQALLAGLWAGIGDCAAGDAYRFTDAAVAITSHKDGRPTETIRRRYRLVTAPVAIRLLRGPDGGPLERSVVKQPGDIEVFTLGRSSYVRRIFRAAEPDVVRLVLVEQRTGRSGPPRALIVDGRPVAGGAPVSYRRCPAS